MPLVVPPGFGSAAFVLEGGVGTQPFITTMGLDIQGVSGLYKDVANRLFQDYADAWLPSTTSDLVLTKVILSVGQDGGDTPTVESTEEAIPGGGTGDYLPLSCALLCNKGTSILGRRGRGRGFIPGVLRDSQVDVSGRLGNTSITAFQGLADDWLAAINTEDPVFGPPVTAVLLHSTTATPPTFIDELRVGLVCGTMARRIK